MWGKEFIRFVRLLEVCVIVVVFIIPDEKDSDSLDRLEAKRKGHRLVVTKNAKEARAILEGQAEGQQMDALIWNRLEIIEQVLNEKCKLLAGFDEEIQQLCEITDLEEEIETADEIRLRILETKGRIAIARGRHVHTGPHRKSKASKISRVYRRQANPYKRRMKKAEIFCYP